MAPCEWISAKKMVTLSRKNSALKKEGMFALQEDSTFYSTLNSIFHADVKWVEPYLQRHIPRQTFTWFEGICDHKAFTHYFDPDGRVVLSKKKVSENRIRQSEKKPDNKKIIWSSNLNYFLFPTLSQRFFQGMKIWKRLSNFLSLIFLFFRRLER